MMEVWFIFILIGCASSFFSLGYQVGRLREQKKWMNDE